MFAATQKHDASHKEQKTAEDTRDGVRHIRDDIRSAAGVVGDDLQDMARQAGRHVRDLAGSAEQHVIDATGSVTTRIRENPVQSSIIALGAGLLLGLLFFRR